MKISTQISRALKDSFTKFDKRKLDSDIEITLDNLDKFIDFVSNNKPEDFKDGPIGKMEYTFICDRLAGNKQILELFNRVYRTQATSNDVVIFLEKRSEAVSAKRDYRIAEKIEESGATSLLSSEIISSDDGFDGKFQIETDKGIKTVLINTILAGGYNIQELHLRTLIKIK